MTNAGNITITNVVVLNNLSGATPIYTAATLAPGAGASFTGSYLTPTNCSTTSTSTATGQSLCGVSVTNTASSTCAITTAPALAVTQTCPAIPTVPGALLIYSGTVTNAGNITLTNVVVLNNLSGATPVYTAATLAPGVGGQLHRQLFNADQLLDHQHLDRHGREHLRRVRHEHREFHLRHRHDAGAHYHPNLPGDSDGSRRAADLQRHGHQRGQHHADQCGGPEQSERGDAGLYGRHPRPRCGRQLHRQLSDPDQLFHHEHLDRHRRECLWRWGHQFGQCHLRDYHHTGLGDDANLPGQPDGARRRC